jgi:hypothetical protein
METFVGNQPMQRPCRLLALTAPMTARDAPSEIPILVVFDTLVDMNRSPYSAHTPEPAFAYRTGIRFPARGRGPLGDAPVAPCIAPLLPHVLSWFDVIKSGLETTYFRDPIHHSRVTMEP